jgi:hypothetical protein
MSKSSFVGEKSFLWGSVNFLIAFTFVMIGERKIEGMLNCFILDKGMSYSITTSIKRKKEKPKTSL